MRVWSQPRNDTLYSSNVYLVLGDWSRIEDVNALVDVGADPGLLEFVKGAPTGVGKRKVDLVVLTHRHYDHTTMLQAVKTAYNPVVAAWGPVGDGVDRALADGEGLVLGDEEFEVIHIPGHTEDSICLYGLTSHALFAGDTPLLINTADGTHEPGFVEALHRIAALPIDTIYFGHGDPLTADCNGRLAASVTNVERSLARHA